MMTTIELSDPEDIYDDTFDFFQNCGKQYLESRNAYKSIAIDTSLTEYEENASKSDFTTKTNICSVKDIAPCTALDKIKINAKEVVPVSAGPCKIKSTMRVTRATRKKSPDVIVISADPSPPRRGRRARKRHCSSPPRVHPDPIIIEDSDGERGTNGLDNSGLDNFILPPPDDNYEMSVKIWWRFGEIHKFPIRRHQKLSSLFDFFSKLEHVPQEQILLTLHDTVNIQPNDTPDSLKLNIADVIEGGITTYKINKHPTSSQTVDENSIQLKLLIKDRKDPLLIYIQKDQNMQTVMTKCAEQLDLSPDKLKFTLDGETLESIATPEDLDLEGGECIDVRIIN